MIQPQPVPEGLLQRALGTAFTTESWPEWDELDLVPEFEGGTDVDDLDFAASAEGHDGEAASEGADVATTGTDATGAPDTTDPDDETGDLPDPLAASDPVVETGNQFDPFDQVDLDFDDFDFS
ncbi:hypothetical protein D8M31_08990 [Corynebacterium genitalium]|nr:hypothetical protein D8M31_08990 [Corynebacterium genitalium]